MSETGVVNIRGKEYRTVALRVDMLREEHPDWSIETEIQSAADLVMVRAVIRDGDRIVATGHAEEDRSKGAINKTSAVENAETSAVGRALAFAGYGGSEIASADEVARAIGQQSEPDPVSVAKATFAKALEVKGVAKNRLRPAAMLAAQKVGKPLPEMDAGDWKKAGQHLDEIVNEINEARTA